MLGALGRIVRRLTEAPAPQRFAWFDSGAVREIAAPAGLALQSTTPGELAIRDSSPEAYITAGRQHPVSIAIRPVLERGDAEREAIEAMTAVLRAANEDPGGFLVHSPTSCTSCVSAESRSGLAQRQQGGKVLRCRHNRVQRWATMRR